MVLSLVLNIMVNHNGLPHFQTNPLGMGKDSKTNGSKKKNTLHLLTNATSALSSWKYLHKYSRLITYSARQVKPYGFATFVLTLWSSNVRS